MKIILIESKILNETSYYKASTTAKGIPVRWSPAEVIEYGKFTIAADVWSFGVLLWELFNRGKVPYGGWNNQQVIDKVLAGELLGIAEAPKDVYSIMLKCWQKDPKQRPQMGTIFEDLQTLYEKKRGRTRRITANVSTGTEYVTIEGTYN